MKNIKKIFPSFLKTKIGISILLGVATISIVVPVLLLNNKKDNNICIVKFNTAGGTLIENEKTRCGGTISSPKAPEKVGFTFAGWYIGDEPIDFNNFVIKDNIVLIAKFVPNADTVIAKITFDSNGGTYVDVIEVAVDSFATKPIDPRFVGYKFAGWYLNDEYFDFSKKITEDIILVAHWDKDENYIYKKNFTDEDGNNIQATDPKEHRCSASGYTNVTSQQMNINTTKNIYNLWNFGLSYGGSGSNPCYVTYKSSDSSIASVDNDGMVKTLKDGNTSISVCVNDTQTKDELLCLSGNLKVVKPQCEYQIDSGQYFDGVHIMQKGTEANWDYRNYNSYSESCEHIYKSSNSSVATVSNSGNIKAVNMGEATLYTCMIDKYTKTSLNCISKNIKVEEDYNSKVERGSKLVEAIDGFYWYLEGYEYAYLYPHVIPWYDHKILKWDSKEIEIINNSFVTSEDSGNYYVISSEINNKFLANPVESAYDLIDRYNMHVSNNKLYITLGSKTYSFRKSTTVKEETLHVSVDKQSVELDMGDTVEINITVSPKFIERRIYTFQSTSIISLKVNNPTSSNPTLSITGLGSGNCTIYIKDNYNNSISIPINIRVRHKEIFETGVSLNKNSIEIDQGSTYRLSATVEPEYTSYKGVTWSSSNNSVASVDDNGTVHGLKGGTAKITATTRNGLTASCDVVVNKKALTGSATLLVGQTCINTNCVNSIVIRIDAKYGTSPYRYSYKLYNSNNDLVSHAEGSSNNEFGYRFNDEGEYRLEYQINDSEGDIVKGEETKTLTPLPPPAE